MKYIAIIFLVFLLNITYYAGKASRLHEEYATSSKLYTKCSNIVSKELTNYDKFNIKFKDMPFEILYYYILGRTQECINEGQ